MSIFYLPGTMTLWGYEDKKDTGQYKGPSHHANNNPMAGMRGAHGTSSLGCSAPYLKSRKHKQGKTGPKELRPDPPCSNSKGHQDRCLDGKATEEVDGPFMYISHLIFPQIWF